MKFHIVMPVFNRVGLTLGCLSGLSAQTDKGFRTILVDDGSTDGTSSAVKEQFPDVKILSGNGQLFWSGSVNLGIRHVLQDAHADDRVLLLNNDTYHETDFISCCRAQTEKYPDALLGSVIVESPENGAIRSGGVRINWYTAKHRGVNQGKNISEIPPGHIEPVSTLTGRGVVIPVKVFHAIGLYDERHFPQCGDTELPRRAEMSGFPLYVGYDMRTYDAGDDGVSVNFRKRYSLSDAFTYFFDIRSHANLGMRFWFAIKTASNPIQGAAFMLLDFCNVIGHFVIRLRLTSR